MEHGINTSNTCAHFYSVDEFKTNHSFVFTFLHELLSPSSRILDSLCHSHLVLMLRSSDLPHRRFSEDKEELFFFFFFVFFYLLEPPGTAPATSRRKASCQSFMYGSTEPAAAKKAGAATCAQRMWGRARGLLVRTCMCVCVCGCLRVSA